MDKQKNKKIKEEKIVNDEDLISDLKDLLNQMEKEKQEYFNGWQREKADFINYKNQQTERTGDLIESLQQEFFQNLLPIVDNFNRAEKAIAEDKKQDQNIKGLLMIKNQLEGILKEQGLEELERVNKKFDPSLDEVVEIIEDQSHDPEIIIEELEKGYCFKGKLIRPAKVKITKSKAN